MLDSGRFNFDTQNMFQPIWRSILSSLPFKKFIVVIIFELFVTLFGIKLYTILIKKNIEKKKKKKKEKEREVIYLYFNKVRIANMLV